MNSKGKTEEEDVLLRKTVELMGISEKEARQVVEGLEECTTFDGKDFMRDREGVRYYSFIPDIEYMDGLTGDLYLPWGVKNFPVVLHIHGGGWVGGARRLLNARWFGQFFACKLGVAFFDVEYNLLPKAFPDRQAQELKCALAYLKTEGRKWGIDTSKVIVMGGSAGGHLSALVAFTAKTPEFPPPQNCPWKADDLSVSASIHFYGVYDMEDALRFLETVVPGITSISYIDKISPIFWTEFVDFPVLIIHGDADFLVPLTQSVALHRKLQTSRLVVIKDAVHAFDAIPTTKYTQRSYEEIESFLRSAGLLGQAPKTLKIPEGFNELVRKGKEKLEEGSFPQAKAYFSLARKLKGTCDTEYGYFNAIFFDTIENLSLAVSSLRGASFSTRVASRIFRIPADNFQNLFPQSSDNTEWKPNLNLYWENWIQPIMTEILDELESTGSWLVENDCKWEGRVKFWLGRFQWEVVAGDVFNKEFALLVLTFVKVSKFILNFMFSHDINFNPGVFSKLAEPVIKLRDDPVGIFRLLAVVPASSESFLTFLRPELFSSSKDDLADTFGYLKAFLEEFFLKPDNRDGEVIALIDADGNGRLSAGDELKFGFFLNGTRFEAPQLLLLPFLNERYIKGVTDLLDKIERNIKVGEPNFLNLSEFRALLPEALRNFASDIDIFPASLSFSLYNFFNSGRPLREFMPEITDYWAGNFGVDVNAEGEIDYFRKPHPVFVVEGELKKDVPAEAIKKEFPSLPDEHCWICKAGPRFFWWKEIPDDCVEPELDDLPLLYIAFRDPSFAGSVWVNTGLIPDSGCDFDNENVFKPADLYSLSKFLAYWQKNLQKILKLLQSFSSFQRALR